MRPTYLYVHESNQVFMMVQLDHEQHPFAAFKTRRFHFIGYMAAHGEVSPLYCDELSEVVKPWLQKLSVVGVLGIPDSVGVIQDHPLFEKTAGDSDFLVKTTFCRSDILDRPGRMWFLSQLSEVSIPFTPAQFPHGFPPSAFEDNVLSPGQQLAVVADDPHSMLESPLSAHATITSDTPSMLKLPYSAPSSFSDTINPSPLDSLLLSTPDSPSIYSTSAGPMFSFGDDGLWPLSSTVVSDTVTVFETLEESYEVVTRNQTSTDAHVQLHPDLQWRDLIDLWSKYEPTRRTNILCLLGRSRCWLRVLTLTKTLLSGSLWVGLYGNPYKLTLVDHRLAITTNFITALRIEGKTYDEVRDQPLILKEGQTEIIIGWQILRTHLIGWFDYTKAELRKVMKGAMTPLTKFCPDSGPSRGREVMRFVELLNSEHHVHVQEAILELVEHQVFAELFWTSMMMPIAGLADGRQSGRVADFFVEDVCTSTKCLAKHPVCNLLTLIYQTMLIVLKNHLGKDRQKELTIYRDHKAMPDVLMAALSPMYDKPHLFPEFTQAVTRLPFIQYENVLHFDPKTKLPRTIGKTKILRTMDDVTPIEVFEGVHTNSLPNNAGFQYFRSLSDAFCFIGDFKPVM